MERGQLALLTGLLLMLFVVFRGGRCGLQAGACQLPHIASRAGPNAFIAGEGCPREGEGCLRDERGWTRHVQELYKLCQVQRLLGGCSSSRSTSPSFSRPADSGRSHASVLGPICWWTHE